ncbi:ran exchange factor prp20 [Grosmannia clavigera kw1407]|uniref:Ran exchange factor prp20 n=1 Tax=Grosmannia clavigera (strain kw1407 / UAMH 11150) TaxID=655863 RepID=F0X9K5_GROCL|nr:ran exchange factor prp20 [Grosmannia clavigera kw1407]EFX05427.1 ran exchange factor prp20 [Grosmannia clavigera kw1407]
MEIRALANQGVVVLEGGGHHSVAVTSDGRCLAWGRLDNRQLGVVFEKSHPAVQTDERDHTLMVTRAASHAAFAAGFNEQGQLGLGAGASDEVTTAQQISGKALKGRTLTWAGAGGQFSMLAGPHVNGA